MPASEARPATERASARPLYVFRDLRTTPGRHAVRVSFARADLEMPEGLALDTTLVLDAGRVVLVTYDEERRQLVVR